MALEGITEYIQRRVIKLEYINGVNIKTNFAKMIHRKNCFNYIKDKPIKYKLSQSLENQFGDKKIDNTINVSGVNVEIQSSAFTINRIDLQAKVCYDFDPAIPEGETSLPVNLFFTQKDSYTPSEFGKEITRNLWYPYLMIDCNKFLGYGILDIYNKIKIKLGTDLFFSTRELYSVMDYSVYTNLIECADPTVTLNRNCKKEIRELLQKTPFRDLIGMNKKNPLLLNDFSLFVPESLLISYNSSSLFNFSCMHSLLQSFYKSDVNLKDRFTMQNLCLDINGINKPFQFVNDIDNIINLLSKHHIEFALSILSPEFDKNVFNTQSHVLNIPMDLLRLWEISYSRSSTEYYMKDFLNNIFGATKSTDINVLREKILKFFHFIIHVKTLNDSGASYVIDDKILMFLEYLYYTQIIKGIEKFVNTSYDRIENYKDRACLLAIGNFKMDVKTLFKNYFEIDENEINEFVIINKIFNDCIEWKDEFIKANVSDTFVDPSVMYGMWLSRISNQSYAV